ncbi:hypothetical protein NCAS_0B01270 [Naumovozyma castellii]|uniref:Uncharacterized protein n=1 Tax=Naumovozyma castellii TaxID=27288 RepID=G0VB87_NAUCA|nr:hypothetical protein NCAS_0B01270 [Naumovozyma castellii CBS 4309]CCC68211.1 hypothetical protein NCAS_0B01270 [Naumovozyma castellii CBS 4309]
MQPSTHAAQKDNSEEKKDNFDLVINCLSNVSCVIV